MMSHAEYQQVLLNRDLFGGEGFMNHSRISLNNTHESTSDIALLAFDPRQGAYTWGKAFGGPGNDDVAFISGYRDSVRQGWVAVAGSNQAGAKVCLDCTEQIEATAWPTQMGPASGGTQDAFVALLSTQLKWR